MDIKLLYSLSKTVIYNLRSAIKTYIQLLFYDKWLLLIYGVMVVLYPKQPFFYRIAFNVHL